MKRKSAPDLAALGSAIRDRRRALKLTQEQLAGRLSWSQERVSTLENGRYGMPSLPLLAELAVALEMPLQPVMEAAGFQTGGLSVDVSETAAPGEARAGMQLALSYALQQLLEIQALTLKDAMDEASDLLGDAVGADKVDVFLYQPEIDSLVALGTSNTDMGRKQIRSGLDRVPIANGGRQVEVFQTGNEYSTGHAEEDEHVARGVVQTLGVRSMYAVPLRVGGTIRGIMVAQSAEANRFSDTERDLFEAASRWVGMVAHRAELHEELARRTEQETRQVVAEEMLTMVAHDLGNQITPIKGRIDLLLRRLRRKGWQDGDGNDAELAGVSASLGQLGHMVTDLLDVSRLEGGIFSISRQPTDLADLVHSVVDEARADRPEIQARAPSELVVEADPARIRQVLQNLIGNAVRHTSPGVPVHVNAALQRRLDGEWAVVEVHDEGPGISPELLPHLFTRHAVGPDSSGLGMGLYLAWGIATAHGGTITVHSAAGAGTTFALNLPLAVDVST